MSEAERERRGRAAEFARSVGLDPAGGQRADPISGDGPEDVPRVVGRIRVDGGGGGGIIGGGGETSGSYAYVLYKPPGWGILGEKTKGGGGGGGDGNATTTTGRVGGEMGGARAGAVTTTTASASSATSTRGKARRVVKAYDEEIDDYTYVEYDEDDVLALLTPRERLELTKEGGLKSSDALAEAAREALAGAEFDDDREGGGGGGGAGGKKKKRGKRGRDDAGDDDESDATRTLAATPPPPPPPPLIGGTKASLNAPSSSRPSLANWLKDLKASEGTPVRGGKYWVAIAGASEIDDSGLVLLCPRDRAPSVHVDSCSYVAVVGNGGSTASRTSLARSIRSSASAGVETCDDTSATFDVLSRMRTHRSEDTVTTVRVTLADGASTCDRAVLLCQDRLGDGVRGDASGDPLDRRSSRRLVHCESMTVSSLADIDGEEPALVVEGVPLPDDVSNYANRRADSGFAAGSFLGRRSGLSRNGLTNVYREINGAADGYPGWFVDRYDKWLYVQQEEEEGGGERKSTSSSAVEMGRGPLPSLHDGYTAGVYYLPIQSDRSIMGAEKRRPVLLEGRAAPEVVPVIENGINYLVNLGDSFSTGIFLDQRLQRAYLADVCNEDTRVLNCFAHAGAFSVAAAASGARTVSLDLDKKWLDRVRPQMEANGIVEWEGRHDVIYGDCEFSSFVTYLNFERTAVIPGISLICHFSLNLPPGFDWLARLAKRNEQFDVVILDPPSTSVGKKKKRWSVKSDMAELVTLAAPLVKSNGLLFTTTNSASLRTEKFVNMCKKGLADAGIPNAKLERVSPMPSDFPSIGSQPVKNLVWRIP